MPPHVSIDFLRAPSLGRHQAHGRRPWPTFIAGLVVGILLALAVLS